MNRFLHNIAKVYKLRHSHELGKIRFIFPNSRSVKLFREYMQQELSKDIEQGADLPKPWARTFSEQAEEMAQTTRVSDLELQMILYKAYTEAVGEGEAQPFDKFVFWIQTLLSDFNEIDKYLVNVDELFKNIHDYKSIQANYLTKEQLEIIRNYWKLDPMWDSLANRSETETEEFWHHLSNNKNSAKFKTLWEMMPAIYKNFNNALDGINKGRANQRPIAYPGKSYRMAASQVRSYVDAHAFTKYVFVGFNNFTASEYLICKELLKLGKADFYWDYNPTLMSDICPMLSRLVKEFPSAYSVTPDYPQQHNVNIYGVPSNYAQTAIMRKALQERTDSESVAVVLPDESLLNAALNNLPKKCAKEANVTIGYPINHTAVAALFDVVVGMQLRSRKNAKGEIEFFRDDVIRVLSNPIVADAYPDAVIAVMGYLRDNNLFNLPASAFANEASEELQPLQPIFASVADAQLDQVTDYVAQVMQFAKAALRTPLEQKYAESVEKQLKQFQTIYNEYGVDMLPSTFFQLLQRTLFRNRVALTTSEENDSKVQVLGWLETRVLDFNRVVMLSMTDRIVPGKRHGRSFVPDVLRRAYGLPTSEKSEEEAAYLFYRLVASARELTLVYDARTGGLQSGDMSRFLYQLRFLTPQGVNVKYLSSSFALNPQGDLMLKPGNCGIKKTDEVMARLNRYRDANQLNRYKLSASALKTYISCPMHFYLERVADLMIPDEQELTITEGVYGTIFHEVAERWFGGSQTRTYDRERLEAVINNRNNPDRQRLDKEIRRAINLHYIKLPKYVTDNDGNKIENPALTEKMLVDDAKLFMEPLKKVFLKMLDQETPGFTYVAGEQNHKFHWDELNINFVMKIDRVDTMNGVTRLIDYKTGSDSMEAASIEALFGGDDTKGPKAVFQVCTYCLAYHASPTGNKTEKLQPLIYPLRKPFGPVIVGKKEVTDFSDVEEAFGERFKMLIDEIFDPEKAFTRTDDESHCRYCKFTELCRKHIS